MGALLVVSIVIALAAAARVIAWDFDGGGPKGPGRWVCLAIFVLAGLTAQRAAEQGMPHWLKLGGLH